jgi:hypothetical protein
MNLIIFEIECSFLSTAFFLLFSSLCTLNDIVRTLLIHSSMPSKFWAEALCTATYLLNIQPSKSHPTPPHIFPYFFSILTTLHFVSLVACVFQRPMPLHLTNSRLILFPASFLDIPMNTKFIVSSTYFLVMFICLVMSHLPKIFFLLPLAHHHAPTDDTKQRCQLVGNPSAECCSKSKFFPRGNSGFNIEL